MTHAVQRAVEVMLVIFMSMVAVRAETFPVDDIEGPVCVMQDTLTGITVPLSPERSQYNVLVTDGLAHITLTQMFVNNFAGISSIVYVFPLPHQGSVHAMSMEYLDSLYTAEIYEKQEAQEIYDSVAASGGAAALLIQHRPNVFQQQLANIAQGDTAYVRIEVSMPLDYNDGQYELAIPTMVAERYQSVNGSPVPSSSSFWNPAPDRNSQTLQINVLLQTGFPISQLESPTHPLRISMVESERSLLDDIALVPAECPLPMPHNRVALLAESDTYPNSDYVLRFRRDNAPLDFSVATYYDTAEDLGHFALNLYPDSTLFAGERPDLEIVLLVDISGSQGGQPILKEKEVCHDILNRLLPTDRLTVLSFNTVVTWAFGTTTPVEATAANIAAARTFVDGLVAGGGTDLLSGIQAALSAPATTEHKRIYVFLTDGFVTNEEAIFEELRTHPTNPTVFTFGAGNNLNRYFLDQAAAINDGYSTEITLAEDVTPLVDAAWEKIESPQLMHVTVDFGNADAENVLFPTGTNLYRGSPLTMYGMYHSPGSHKITVTGYVDGVQTDISRTVAFAGGPTLNRMAPQIWARQKIEQLAVDEGTTTANKDSIIAVSVEYQVLSEYTAFLAINPTSVDDGSGIGDDLDNAWTVGVEQVSPLAGRQFCFLVQHGMLHITMPEGELLREMVVMDLMGRVVYRLQLGGRGGVESLRWDGRTAGGTLLRPGRYVVRLQTTTGHITRTLAWHGQL